MKNKKTKKPHHSGITHSKETPLEKILTSSLSGLLISIAIAIALLLISTAILLSTPDPTAFIDPVGYVALYITALLGGFACSKLDKRSPYLCALICGLAFTLLRALSSLALPHTLDSGMDILTRLLLHTLSLFAFPLGALLGIKSAKPQRKRKRR